MIKTSRKRQVNLRLRPEVVIMATPGSSQSERSKIGLDQSESRISPMWLIDVTNQGFNPRDPME